MINYVLNAETGVFFSRVVDENGESSFVPNPSPDTAPEAEVDTNGIV